MKQQNYKQTLHKNRYIWLERMDHLPEGSILDLEGTWEMIPTPEIIGRTVNDQDGLKAITSVAGDMILTTHIDTAVKEKCLIVREPSDETPEEGSILPALLEMSLECRPNKIIVNLEHKGERQTIKLSKEDVATFASIFESIQDLSRRDLHERLQEQDPNKVLGIPDAIKNILLKEPRLAKFISFVICRSWEDRDTRPMPERFSEYMGSISFKVRKAIHRNTSKRSQEARTRLRNRRDKEIVES